METLQRTANRGSISTGYDIDNSLKLEPDNTEYLYKTQSNGNKKTWTCSFWFKRTELNDADFPAFISATSSSWATRISIFNDGAFWVDLGYGTSYYRNIANALIRDTSAWYHFVVAVDSTQATASDRLKAYINGNLITSWNTQNLPAQNTEFKFFDSAHDMYIGNYNNAVSFLPAGYMADMHLVEGQQLAPTSFGEFDDDSGIWKPKAYTGSYGTNGFYLDFKNASSLGADSSGNGNNFTLNNITSADQATDTPTNNFAIPNVIGTTRTNAFTYTEGGTKVIHTGGSDWNSWANTIAVGSGKWYAEFKIIGGNSHFVGVGSEDYYFVGAGSGTGFPEIYYGYSGTNSVGYHNTNGDIYNNGTQVALDPVYGDGDIISVALDMDNGKVYFAKNGTYMNSQNPVTGTNSISLPDTSARYFIGTSHYTSSIGAECNFGGYTSFTISSAASDDNGYGTFEYAPPSGFYAMCTKNLEEFG